MFNNIIPILSHHPFLPSPPTNKCIFYYINSSLPFNPKLYTINPKLSIINFIPTTLK